MYPDYWYKDYPITRTQIINLKHEIISNLRSFGINYNEFNSDSLSSVRFNILGGIKLSFVFKQSDIPEGRKLIHIRLAYDVNCMEGMRGVHITTDGVAMRPTHIFVMKDGEDVAVIDLIEA